MTASELFCLDNPILSDPLHIVFIIKSDYNLSPSDDLNLADGWICHHGKYLIHQINWFWFDDLIANLISSCLNIYYLASLPSDDLNS